MSGVYVVPVEMAVGSEAERSLFSVSANPGRL